MMSVDTARSAIAAARVGEPVEVALGGVAPVHRGEDAVAARLQRVVEVLARRGDLGHGGERLGPHVLGVRAGETDPADALDGADLAQQLGEQRAESRRFVAGLARPASCRSRP